MNSIRSTLLIGSIATSLAVTQAFAIETVDGWDLKYVQGALSTVSVSYRQNLSDSYTTISANAGLLKFDPGTDTYTAMGNTFPLQGTAFWTYCTDVGVWLHTNNADDEGNGWDYIPSSFTGQDGVNPNWTAGGAYEAAYIYNKLIEGYASLNAGPGQTKIWGDLNFDPLSANQEYAAAQVAIWEVLYDSTYDLTDGRLKLNTTGTIATYANAILAQLLADKAANGGSLPVIYDTTWLQPIYDDGSEGGSQGLLYPPIPSWTPPSVPDGGVTIGLLGFALLGIDGLRRKLKA